MERLHSAACSVKSKGPKRGIDAIMHHKTHSAIGGPIYCRIKEDILPKLWQ